MKAYGIQSKRSGYKLAQLCETAGFHPSTVHYYVKIGLLHKPRKVGLGLFLYDDAHIQKLQRIRNMREKERLSLSKIQERLKNEAKVNRPAFMTSGPGKATHHTEAVQEVQVSRQAELTRKRLLDVATGLFSKKGYEGTTISDVTEAIGMSKGSFYLYFRDKRELFIECIERLPYVLFPEETWEDISHPTDYVARQTKRVMGFLEAFPSYAGILNLVKMVGMGNDPSLARKANQALARIVEPIVRDFREALENGAVRELDEEFFGYAVLGIAENVAYKLATDSRYDLGDTVEKFLDIVAHGILPQVGALPVPAEPRRRSGKITDVRGETVKVREICFGGKPYLVGRIGQGEIRPDTERIASIRVDHTGPGCIVEVTMTDGERTVLEQDSNLIVSAASSVGLYTIPFHRVLRISFV